MIVGLIGLGFVGSAVNKSFTEKGVKTLVYDKYKKGGIGDIKNCLKAEIIFLCLPTLYCKEKGEYDKTAINDVCTVLCENNYQGVVILKSTVEPETTQNLFIKYGLNLIHNPEFLTARTAYEDFHNQTHIVLGKEDNCDNEKYNLVKKFYKTYFPNAEISQCSSRESESMKSFINSFYAVKVQFFTELYLLCKQNNTDYNKIKDMMLKNGWINSMHTIVPGPDNNISYGGACFPKDTNALCKYMEKYLSPNKVLEATIMERNSMRDD